MLSHGSPLLELLEAHFEVDYECAARGLGSVVIGGVGVELEGAEGPPQSGLLEHQHYTRWAS
jgi:hypothetical protein